MNIFILEDDLNQQVFLQKLIEKRIRDEKLPEAHLFVTSRPADILDQLKVNVGFNLYFLDIEIRGIQQEGFELAKKIREHDPFGLLVFVTTHSEFLPLTFKQKLMALDFIDKLSTTEEFQQAVSECLRIAYDRDTTPVSQDAFMFKNKHTTFQMPFSDIYFFETTDITHKLRLVSKHKVSEFYANLSEIELLDKRFFKCHKSFVVNVNNIDRIEKSTRIVHFKQNYQCLVSRSKMKGLQSILEQM